MKKTPRGGEEQSVPANGNGARSAASSLSMESKQLKYSKGITFVPEQQQQCANFSNLENAREADVSPLDDDEDSNQQQLILRSQESHKKKRKSKSKKDKQKKKKSKRKHHRLKLLGGGEEHHKQSILTDSFAKSSSERSKKRKRDRSRREERKRRKNDNEDGEEDGNQMDHNDGNPHRPHHRRSFKKTARADEEGFAQEGTANDLVPTVRISGSHVISELGKSGKTEKHDSSSSSPYEVEKDVNETDTIGEGTNEEETEAACVLSRIRVQKHDIDHEQKLIVPGSA